MASGKAPAIGIDLGTTYSCVGVFQNGKVEIIANDQGNRTTPSYVAFTDSERLIGDAAKNQVAMNPQNTIFDVKRLIGRQFEDEDVQTDTKHWPFRVTNRDGKPMLQVEYLGETKTLSPEEVSSMVLTKMKKIAETFCGQKIIDVVMTVPAHFNDDQRQATKQAGVIAGLNIIRLISEPTAAAIAYGLDTKFKDRRELYALIFDLGGRTLDVSLMLIEEGLFEIRTSARDTCLGGEDFDNRLVNHLIAEFSREHKKDLTTNPVALHRLHIAAEQAKSTLLTSAKAIIKLDSLFEGTDLDMTVSKAQFEELCADLFPKCLKPVEKAIRDAKIDKKIIDTVVLVGGSTQIPKIQELLQGFLDGKELNKSINPQEVVAYGAAMFAAAVPNFKPIVCCDAAPLSLGIETAGGAMTNIIPRYAIVPTRASKTFTTNVDNQPGVSIQVFEGERPMAKDNTRHGHFELTGIPPAPRGVARIEVTFDIDANGTMTVTAKDDSTGRSEGITFPNEQRLSREDIQRMMDDAQRFKENDDALRQLQELEGRGNQIEFLETLRLMP